MYTYETEINNYAYKVMVMDEEDRINIKALSLDSNKLSSLVLGYMLKDEKAEVLFMADQGKVIANDKDSKFVYKDEEFILQTNIDRTFATRVLLAENYDILKPILGKIKTFKVVESLRKELEASNKDMGVIEYINMKKDQRLKEFLKEYKEKA